MEYSFLLFAFICGLSVKLIGIPPLVGYLLAGFILHAVGFNATEELTTIANLGITIMLFTIGLKLNIRDLGRREVWANSLLHTTAWVALCSSILYGAAVVISYLTELSIASALLIAFALSFSSTVCVVKVLEESGESKTRHGKIAIGVLVMQDIFAVVFMVVATGKIPSVYALLLLLLIPLMPVFYRIINKSGHGELLPLTGFIFALGGYHLFEAVNIKGDLGALLAGLLLARHGKAVELAKSLMSFKDLFLIGFFLSIGLTALPDTPMLLTGLALCLLLPLKFAMFYFLFMALRLRARTAFLSSLVLGNYSEFGLIVGALAVSLGMLDANWLVIIAISVSTSFVFTSIAYKSSHQQYNRFKESLKRFEKTERLNEDIYPVMTNAQFLVIGMGRVGIGAFTSLSNLAKDVVWGMDADRAKINSLKHQGHNVVLGDGEDIDLWENLDMSQVRLILLALPSIEDAINVTSQLKQAKYEGKIAAIARYQDEVDILLDNGVDKVFNFFTDAGLGFAEESLSYIGDHPAAK
ncbi:potassium transporter Kef [Alteromonas sediminis]|uniref:Potassium transporter Kef n=1 Tax=Alteromonas sediminis TaxID=2259342 RepID=A0A3N5YD52_9ALTE|nr:cation:proton antiporter family protein [Alteromonas sediminis]RPJ67395.1 potassium transporter Kef [Alteromonas sediminis]